VDHLLERVLPIPAVERDCPLEEFEENLAVGYVLRQRRDTQLVVLLHKIG
jgi:hypothetical protein